MLVCLLVHFLVLQLRSVELTHLELGGVLVAALLWVGPEVADHHLLVELRVE